MNIIDLENILSKYKISKPKYRSREIKNVSIPSMISVFRTLINNGIPPQQMEFVNEFKCLNPDIKSKGIVSKLKIAYLSFVREYHLKFLLENHFTTVIYSEEADISGVDYTIVYRGKTFYIHAFVDSPEGRYWRGIKNGRHNFKGIHLDLPINLSSGKRVGKFVLYTDTHISKLKREMNKFI